MTSEELKKWRIKHDYSQSQLARTLGVITLTVSRWETGEREIPSFLHLALNCITEKGGGIRRGRPVKDKLKEKKTKKKKEV